MGLPLLLDEMLSGTIAGQLRSLGHDVAVTQSALVGLGDQAILEAATRQGRAVVTANIKDFMPLDQAWRAAGRTHAGLVLISTKTFPQDGRFVGAVVAALQTVLDGDGVRRGAVVFLRSGDLGASD